MWLKDLNLCIFAAILVNFCLSSASYYPPANYYPPPPPVPGYKGSVVHSDVIQVQPTSPYGSFMPPTGAGGNGYSYGRPQLVASPSALSYSMYPSTSTWSKSYMQGSSGYSPSYGSGYGGVHRSGDMPASSWCDRYGAYQSHPYCPPSRYPQPTPYPYPRYPQPQPYPYPRYPGPMPRPNWPPQNPYYPPQYPQYPQYPPGTCHPQHPQYPQCPSYPGYPPQYPNMPGYPPQYPGQYPGYPGYPGYPQYPYHRPARAVAELRGANKVEGTVQFEEMQNRHINIRGKISGLTPGAHGFHILEKPMVNDDCTSGGKHYNPQNVDHGGKADWVRHVGDLGNILADNNGIAYFDITDQVISLTGGYNVINRTLIVTERADDLGRNPDIESKTNGNSGPPVACGIIKLAVY